MKIFISSLIGGMEEIRQAAHNAIVSLGHTPVEAESFSATPSSSQVACLSGVREADIIILILGDRYGAVQKKSGISATHEEYKAAKGNKPILVFVSEFGDREEKQQNFISEVENWEDGEFRAAFTEASDLRNQITQAIRNWEVSNALGPVDTSDLMARGKELLKVRDSNHYARYNGAPKLEIVVAGGPTQQIIRPSEIEKPQLAKSILQEALFGENPIFRSNDASEEGFVNGSLILTQPNGNSILLDESGSIVLSTLLKNSDNGLNVILEEDVARKLKSQIKFAAWLLKLIDHSERISRVVLLAQIQNGSYSNWRTKAEQQANPNSIQHISRFGQQGDFPVHLSPVDRARAALSFEAEKISEDLTTLLRRQHS